MTNLALFAATALGALSLAVSLAAAQSATPPAPTALFKVDISRTVMAEDASLPGHTIYRPVKPFKSMPVVVWGNSGCVKAGNSASPFLGELAAAGYLVVASGPIANLAPTLVGVPPRIVPPADASPPAVDPATGRPAGPTAADLTKTSDLADAISWAEAQNKKKGTPYYGRLDTAHVAAMGTSCGGLQAIEISKDPRVKSLVILSSGLLDRPRAGANATEADLKAGRGPILYLSGGSSDGATAATKKDFDRIDARPIVYGNQEGAGHVPLTGPNGGDWPPVVVAWLDWQFKGDQTAAKMFKGASCGLCAKPGWTIQKKRID